MALVSGFHVKLPIVFLALPAPGAVSRVPVWQGRRYRSEEV